MIITKTLQKWHLHLCSLLLFSMFVSAQNQPNINSDVPNISPPSPTVAALMKFEEMPVNNYTGIPDISIPLYSIQSRSKDIAVNLALSYHPASIAASEVASYTGLGWNLMAGGTISRTVKGYPDEIFEAGRIGIYRDSDATNQKNIFYEVCDHMLGGPTVSEPRHSEYMWLAHERGRFDTEQDLYQFNFMGHAGRFLIKKTDSAFEIVRLDNDDNLKINFTMDYTTYKVTAFTIRDDVGHEYVFSIREVTTETGSSGSDSGGSNNPSGASTYFSSYHLSAVNDLNGMRLLTLEYNNDSEVYMEQSVSKSVKYYVLNEPQPGHTEDELTHWCDNRHLLMPTLQYSGSTRNTNTKKLKQIVVEGKAIIDFQLASGRIDSENNSAYRLKKVIIKNIDGSGIKQFELVHDYSIVSSSNNFGARMILSEIIESNFTNDGLTMSHKMYYKTQSNYNEDMVYQDYWGYYNLKPECRDGVGFYRETTPDFVTTDVLQKIKLPTGGCQIFNFESNTYSYIGSESLTNFDENPKNWVDGPPAPFSWNAQFTTQYTFSVNEEQYSCLSAGSNLSGQWHITVSRIGGGFYVGFTNDTMDPHLYPRYELLPVGDYKVIFSPNVFPLPANYYGSATVTRKNRARKVQKYLYGGGVRIGKIGYFKNDVDQAYYESTDNVTLLGMPDKEKNYNYQFFDDDARSSGSLVFAKPIYTYEQTIDVLSVCPGGISPDVIIGMPYLVIADHNNLLAQKTQGADVGYKNVTVSETDNGKSQYVYTSPIDAPEENYVHSYPFFPTKNYDYKRGLLSNEKIFDKYGAMLTSSDYVYEIVQDSILTGIRYYSAKNCGWAGIYINYSTYKRAADVCNEVTCRTCGQAYTYISRVPIFDAFGRSKLIEKISRDYFYKPDNTSDIVENKETFAYNAVNKKLSAYSKEIYKSGSMIVDKKSEEYDYYTDPGSAINNNISNIQEVRSFLNNELTSRQKILYHYFVNCYKPQKIQQAKGSNPLETKVNFNSYDISGNPLEINQEDGITISYLWGYNRTQPIAVIENASYTQIAAAAAIDVQALSSFTEADISAIDALRAVLPNARITTYEYMPLVGVTSVTDSRGFTTTYSYDSFGRLSTVRDQDENIISENKYRYSNQN